MHECQRRDKFDLPSLLICASNKSTVKTRWKGYARGGRLTGGIINERFLGEINSFRNYKIGGRHTTNCSAATTELSELKEEQTTISVLGWPERLSEGGISRWLRSPGYFFGALVLALGAKISDRP
jgi:hypothetical protein